jgi:LysM repeat protein
MGSIAYEDMRLSTVACPDARRQHGTVRAVRIPDASVRMRLTARGRVVVVLLSLLLVGVWSLRASGAVAGTPAQAIAVTPMTVAAGETLWDIAVSIAGPDEDVRDVVDRLMEINGLDGVGLRVGQQILVPDERP